jgi:uncharacterized protein (DUF1778 family)
MPVPAKREARLNVRLPDDSKAVIEAAAAVLGQTVSDYAVSTLVRNSREVIEQESVTVLSNRDRDRFIAAMDDLDAKPNKALAAAAKRYKRWMKQNGGR